MSVHKKKGRWYAAVYVGIKNGKQEYEWSEGYDKKPDAQLWELEMKKKVIEREHRVYDKTNLGYTAELWLKTKKNLVAPSTYEGYKNCYDFYIKPKLSDKKIKDIDTADVYEFMNSLNYKPSTIHRIMTTLNQIFNYAIEINHTRLNPCYGVKKPLIRKPKRKTWSEKEINQFLKRPAVKNSTCYTALSILFATGMRPGEVCGLRWCDFDGEGFILVNGVDKHRELTDLKNDKADDIIYLDARLIMQLNKTKAVQEDIYRQQKEDKKAILPEETYINCFTDDWRPMTPDYLYKTFKKLLDKLNLPHITLYEAQRHSFGTNMMKAGVNPRMVADMMRHSTVRVTLDNYSHTDKKMYKDTIKMYNKKIL